MFAPAWPAPNRCAFLGRSRARFDYSLTTHGTQLLHVSLLMNFRDPLKASAPPGVRSRRSVSPFFIMFSFLSFVSILSLILHSFDAIVKAQGAPQYSSTGLLSTTQAGPVVPDRTGLPATLAFTNGPLPTSTGKNGSCKNVQAAGVSGDSQRAQAIKDAFVYAWDAYEKYAYGFDELEPLSANGTNSRYGWGLTIVDSIDTAIIMELEDVVEKMLKFISTVDFTTTDEGDPVNLSGE